jgi:5'-nucleotidase
MPIDPEKTYRVAITDFLASGGDGYKLFAGKPSENTGLPLRELIVDTIRARGYIVGSVEGRIVRVEEENKGN